MALRVRPRAPQDENAAMPHLSGKMQASGGMMPMMGKTGGLKQQQQGGNPERKKLSNITNITNALKPVGANSKPPLKILDSGNSSSKTVKPRVPLRNITNENAVSGQFSPSNAPSKDLKQAPAKPKTVGPKLETPKSEEPKPWAKYSAPLADPEMEKLVQEWAEVGIEETAGATGDELDALRRQREDKEIEERVAAIRAYRMPLPSFLFHNDDGLEMKEVLEMDPYEFTPSAVPETPFPGAEDGGASSPEMDWGKPSIPLDELLAYTCSEDDIPSIPEDWHIVKNLPVQKPVQRRPPPRTWL